VKRNLCNIIQANNNNNSSIMLTKDILVLSDGKIVSWIKEKEKKK